MKATSSALTATFILLACTGTTQAQHFSLQHFDDLTFAAMSETRMLRWEIHDNFAESRDRDRLLGNLQNVMDHLHSLQRSIYLERNPRAIDRELDAVLEDLVTLRKNLMNSDYARHRGPQFHHHANGYVFIPETLHAGRHHVDHALRHLDRIERNLNEFHHELMAFIDPRGSRGREPIPTTPSYPTHPGHIHGPLMVPPASSQSPTPAKGNKKKVSSVQALDQTSTSLVKRSKYMPKPGGSTTPPRPFTEAGLKWVQLAAAAHSTGV